ncbi:MAG TPA: class II aldolase/adducin family protein [Herpetosiphonaceae bacterium]
MGEREQVADEIIELGRLLHGSGIFRARAGNISARLGDGTLLITTPSTHKGLLRPADLIALDGDGAPLEPGASSSETPLHLAAYRASPRIGAVLHAHPVACTVLAHRGLALAAGLAEEGRPVLGEPPLLDEADLAARDAAWGAAVAAGTRAALLARHGAIVAGADLRDAFCKIELCEWIAELQLRLAALGAP